MDSKPDSTFEAVPAKHRASAASRLAPTDMDVQGAFSPDYDSARSRFLAAAELAGCTVESIRNPACGAKGKALFTDVAMLGSASANRVVFASCATHGIEGFLGSAILSSWLRSHHQSELPANTRFVLLHAVNPYGFSWMRRVNEDNIDLNRNFIDHARAYPGNDVYESLHSVMCPEQWNAASAQALQLAIGQRQKKLGKDGMESALSRGQHAHPDGIFFAGRQAAWSNVMMCDVLRRYLGRADNAILMDFHTGLGKFADCTLIVEQASANFNQQALAAACQCPVISADADHSVFPELEGTLSNAASGILPGDHFLAVTAEFGTYPPEQVLESLCADNWVHQLTNNEVLLDSAIKQRLKENFCPADPAWREITLTTGIRLLDAILAIANQELA